MYFVVEFGEDANNNGGVGLVREEWLTPKKTETFWPPHKLSVQYNKCLTEGHIPNEKWSLHSVKRIFYSTDDILKAREKLRAAECESELLSEEDTGNKRVRKQNKKFILSSSEDSEEERKPGKHIKAANDNQGKSFSLRKQLPTPPPQIIAIRRRLEDTQEKEDSSFDKVVPCASNPVLIGHNYNGETGDAMPTTNLSGLEKSFDVIAKCLARIEKNIQDIQTKQNFILETLLPGQNNIVDVTAITNEIRLPCASISDIGNLEKWLQLKENEARLVKKLSLIGGKKVKNIVRRILETIFTNDLALEYNWTGKNKKIPLKDLHLINVIEVAVRRNGCTQTATDDEIQDTIKNWFRFTKDRDGGRDARRKPPQEKEIPLL